MKTEEKLPVTWTVSGTVLAVEESHGKELWVAFVLKGNKPTKIVLRGTVASNALKEIAAGHNVVASGDLVNFDSEKGVIKLFASECMKLT